MALNDGTFAFANAQYLYNIGADSAPLSTLRTTTASDGPIASVGDLIGRIEDLSGNGRHLLLTTTPAAELSRTHGLGGKKAIYPRNKTLRYECTTTLPSGNNLIYAAVVYTAPGLDYLSTANATIWSENDAAGKSGHWRRGSGATFRWSFYHSNGWSEAGTQLPRSHPVVLIWEFASGALQFWLNGEKDGTGSTTYNFSSTTPNIKLFQSGSGNAQQAMHLAFLGRWDTTASDADIEALSADLMAEFSIDSGASYFPFDTEETLFTPSLPSGHSQGTGYLPETNEIVLVSDAHITRHAWDGTVAERAEIPFTGTQDHASGGNYFRRTGRVYCSVSHWDGSATETETLAIDPYNLSGGATDRWDTMASGRSCSGLIITDDEGIPGSIVHSEYVDSTTLVVRDLANVPDVARTIATGVTNLLQGVGVVDDYYILSHNNNGWYRLHKDNPGVSLPIAKSLACRQGLTLIGRNRILGCDTADEVRHYVLNDRFFDFPTLDSGNEWMKTWASGARRRRKLICGV